MKVINIHTGKMENCTVGSGCKRHMHKAASSETIESVSSSLQNDENVSYSLQKTASFHIVRNKDEASDHDRAWKLLLYVNEGDDFSPAFLEYHTDPIGVVYIDYLKSNIEGQGHARALLDYIYNRYQTQNIDWGEILHPAASHLYEEYSNKYGRSYSWEDWEDTNW